MFPALLLFVIAWGVLSFGAVYSWAFRPLMAGAAACGVLLLWRSPRRQAHSLSVVLVSLVILPILLQTIPLPHSVIRSVAPFNARFLQAFDLRFNVDGGAWHALSVDPSLTLTSAAFLVIGVIWIAGVARGLGSSVSLVSLIRNIVLLSVLLSLLALAQKAMFNGKIYWFWESQFGVTNNYFGPFVNRNHFAGWMLLTLSLGGGYFMGRIAVAGDRMKLGVRERLLWIGSPQGGGVVITAVALMVMAVSLVWTLSRSGIAGAAVAIVILTAATLRRATTVARRALAAGLVVLAFGGAALWKGLDSLALWYGDTHTLEWRFALWRDSLAPLKDFWLLGSGLNTYGTVMLLYPQTDATVHAQQAHNDYLQLAVEGGLLVGIPVLIAIVLLARLMWRRSQQPQDEMTWWIRMGAIAGICGMAIQEISDFSLQIPGVALLFATCLAIAIHEPAPLASSRSEHRERRRLKSRAPDGIYASVS